MKEEGDSGSISVLRESENMSDMCNPKVGRCTCTSGRHSEVRRLVAVHRLVRAHSALERSRSSEVAAAQASPSCRGSKQPSAHLALAGHTQVRADALVVSEDRLRIADLHDVVRIIDDGVELLLCHAIQEAVVELQVVSDPGEVPFLVDLLDLARFGLHHARYVPLRRNMLYLLHHAWSLHRLAEVPRLRLLRYLPRWLIVLRHLLLFGARAGALPLVAAAAAEWSATTLDKQAAQPIPFLGYAKENISMRKDLLEAKSYRRSCSTHSSLTFRANCCSWSYWLLGFRSSAACWIAESTMSGRKELTTL